MKIIILLVSFALSGSAAQSFADETTPTTTEDRAQQLIQHAKALPDVSPDRAEAAARAALLAETEAEPAEVLLAIAWGESRFIPSTVTGHACGPMQTIGWSRTSCQAMQIPLVGFLVGAAELRLWLRVARGDLRQALLGYACGYSAFDGSCAKQAWPAWVLRRAARLGWRSKHGVRPML